MLFGRSASYIAIPPTILLLYLVLYVQLYYKQPSASSIVEGASESQHLEPTKPAKFIQSPFVKPSTTATPQELYEAEWKGVTGSSSTSSSISESASSAPTQQPFSFTEPDPNIQHPEVPGHLGKFPPIIWQSTGPKQLDDGQLDDIASWRFNNPFFDFHLLTDAQADEFVALHYAHRPDIVQVFHALPVAILRADLLRYLLLLAKGGIWVDIDVKCEKKVSEWLPEEFTRDASTVELVIGLEFDGDFHQFVNWAMMARPGNKHLQRVVDSIVAELQVVAASNNIGVEGLKLDMISDVVKVTGPVKMSEQVMESLQQDLGRDIDYHEYIQLKAPKQIGDVLILPGNAFAAAQSGYPEDQGPALVTHHYWGSWKTEADAAREHREKLEKEEKERKEKEEKEEKEKKEKEEKEKKEKEEGEKKDGTGSKKRRRMV